MYVRTYVCTQFHSSVGIEGWNGARFEDAFFYEFPVPCTDTIIDF